jgi:hypothetical protein
MGHSVSLIDPVVMKFLPCLTSDASVVAELAVALRGFAMESTTHVGSGNN